MSTETTKKKIKIDNGTEFARVYTDKEVDSKLTNKQDTLVSGTNIKTLNGQSILGSGDLPVSGGSSIYKLTLSESQMTEFQQNQQFTLTDEQHTNLLNSELINFIIGTGQEGNSYVMNFVGGSFGTKKLGYFLVIDQESSLDMLFISSDSKIAKFSYKVLGPNSSSDTNIDLYNHFIKITGTKDNTQVRARFTIQSSNNLVVDTPEKLATLLGNEFELGCNGIYGNYNITGLKKTADGALNIIYNNGGAESLLNTTGITLTIGDTVKII